MKIILSKKGYDDSNGGYPSIILPDKTMLSFPIPISKTEEYGVNSSDIIITLDKDKEKTLKDIFTELNHKQSNLKHHLDPDISRNIKNSLAAKFNIGIFGQSWVAGSWLERVEPGDIFIFFGTFTHTYVHKNGGIRYRECYYPFHAVWGYLQVDKIISIKPNDKDLPEEISFIKEHPHWINRNTMQSYRKNNKIFLGRNFGCLKYQDKNRLTKLGCKKTC